MPFCLCLFSQWHLLFTQYARGRVYSKELSLISYNGANAVYDIRNWTDYHDEEARMGKGITLNREELKALRDALNGMDL